MGKRIVVLKGGVEKRDIVSMACCAAGASQVRK